MAIPEPPIVTIVTATFGHGRYIRQCLESAIAQTDPRWELIIVDDGSVDGTQAVVGSITDQRIRYRRLPHRGISSLADSYNVALSQAQGAFIAVLEGDDFWPRDKLELQLALFERPDVVMTWGRAAVCDEVGEVTGVAPHESVIARMRGMTPGETAHQLLLGNVIPACTVICRRDALLRIGGFQQPDGVPTTDYPTWLELCRVGSIVGADSILGYYRRHPGQASVQMAPEMERVLDWGTEFVERLPADERAALGLSVATARRIQRDHHSYLAYGAGRRAMRNGQARLARAYFRRSLRLGFGVTGVKATIGLVCATFGLDFECIVGAAGRLVR